MRTIFFLPALLCFFSLHAQLPSDLDKLEGKWFCKACAQPTWSEWIRVSNEVLTNRTYTVSGSDTTEISRLEISLRDGKFTVLRQIKPGKPVQTFRLTQSAPYEFFWENENMASFQTCLKMEFYGSRRLVIRGENGPMDFRRKREKGLAISLQGQVGSSWSDVKSVIRYPDFQYHIPGVYSRQLKPGAELGLALNIRDQNGNMGVNIEFGLLQRQIGADATNAQGGVYYTRKGIYHSTDLYLAIVPEARFGKQRAFSVSAGYYRGFVQKRTLDGTLSFTANPNPSASDYQYVHNSLLKPEIGVLAGMNYRLPFSTLSGIRPEVYCRAMYSGSNLRVCSISAGMRFHLGGA